MLKGTCMFFFHIARRERATSVHPCYASVIGDLDKGINVIVGQNGGGKSNILEALEFVFTCKAKCLICVVKRIKRYGLKLFYALLFFYIHLSGLIWSISRGWKIIDKLRIGLHLIL